MVSWTCGTLGRIGRSVQALKRSSVETAADSHASTPPRSHAPTLHLPFALLLLLAFAAALATSASAQVPTPTSKILITNIRPPAFSEPLIRPNIHIIQRQIYN